MGLTISGRLGAPVYSSFGASSKPARSVSQLSYPARREIGSRTPELWAQMASARNVASTPFSQFARAAPSLSHLNTGRAFGTETRAKHRELMGSSSSGGAPSFASASSPAIMWPAAGPRRSVFDAERVSALGPPTTATPLKVLDAVMARSHQSSTGLTMLPSTDRWQPGLLGAHATVHHDSDRPGYDNQGIFNTYLNSMVRSSPPMYFPQLAEPRPRPDYPSSMA